MQGAFYDTKGYDRESFGATPVAGRIQWRYHEFRLTAETAATTSGAEAVCVFVNDRVDAECVELLASIGVKLIALRCAGHNNVDFEAARRHSLRVIRVPAYSPHAVAEHAVALYLCLNRKIHRAYSRVRDHNFSLSRLVGSDVHGKTIGIVGTGRIGKVTAEIFRGFGTRVLAFDPAQDCSWAEAHDVEYTSLETLLRESHVVSLHLPLTPETLYLINEERISLMQDGAFLINTGRGKLVDTTALISALKAEHLGGVALDVYEEEEGLFFEDLSGIILQDDELSRLLTFPNVLVTSHQGFLTREALGEIARVTTENLLRFESGKPFIEGTAL